MKRKVVIVGAGPAGLSCATLLAQTFDVIIIDAESQVGGCHRVIRTTDGIFSEHAPRVYSNSYINTMRMISLLGQNWDDYFVPYNFTISSIASEGIFGHLSIFEITILAGYYIILLLPMCHEILHNTPVSVVAKQWNFSQYAQDYLDRLCRLTDGASSDRYSMWQFLQLFNQQILYSLYQPRRPNDEFSHQKSGMGLMAMWQSVVKSKCKLYLNTKVLELHNSKKVVVCKNDKNRWLESFDVCILAVTPSALQNITGVPALFSQLTPEWVEKSKYIDYIPVVLHFKQQLPHVVVNTYGFPETEWGIVFVVTSAYFDHPSHGIVSTTITRPNVKSKHIQKCANECTEIEIVTEVYRQPGGSNFFPPLWRGFITPGTKFIVHNGVGKWVANDNAFIAAAGVDYMPFESNDPSIFTVGTHTGHSWYQFSSMESAVSNAIALCHNHMGVQTLIPYTGGFQVSFIIYGVLVLLLCVFVWYMR